LRVQRYSFFYLNKLFIKKYFLTILEQEFQNK
jgi:hypothetical protein